MSKFLKISTLIFIIGLIGCGGTISYNNVSNGKTEENAAVFPEYSGKQVRIAVLPIGLSPAATKEYPEYTKELTKKGVGMNMWHYLDESLQKTNRFEFEHIPEGAAEKIIEDQWFGQTDLVDPSTALKLGKIKLARYFVYGSVIGFWPEEIKKVKGLKSSSRIVYHIVIALRFVDGETLEYTSATGEGKGASISEACAGASDKAVLNLIGRLDEFLCKDKEKS